VKQYKPAHFILLILLFGFRPNLTIADETNSPPKPSIKQSWLRPGLQFLTFMGYSQTRYWVKYASYIEDWQFHFNWKDQCKRWFTLDAWRFDSNAFTLNWTHALAGGIYYGIARSNGLGQKNALIFTLAASAYWEYLVEWREVISINDMVFTPAGGYVMGELWYRITRSVYNRKTAPARMIASLFNPLLVFNPPKRLGPDRDETGWIFSGELGLSSGSEQRSPGFSGRTAYNLSLFFTVHSDSHPDPYGQFNMRARFASDHLSELRFFALTPHSLSTCFNDRKTFLTFNWASAFSFYQRQSQADYDSTKYQIRVSPEDMLAIPRNYQDKMAILHLLGPQINHHSTAGSFRLKNTLSLYTDFSLFNALALNEYSRKHALHSMTSTAFAYGYYYGLGLSAFLDSTASLAPFTLNTSLAFAMAWSVNSHDRFNEKPPLSNKTCRDGFFLYTAALSWSPASWPVAFLIEYEGQQRWGRIEATKSRETMSIISAGVKVKL